MSNWRDQILRKFTPNVARLTLVADPDGLLLEEGVLAGIRERGFELIPFEDRLSVRLRDQVPFLLGPRRADRASSRTALRGTLPIRRTPSWSSAVVQLGRYFSQPELSGCGGLRPERLGRAGRCPEVVLTRCAGR